MKGVSVGVHTGVQDGGGPALPPRMSNEMNECGPLYRVADRTQPRLARSGPQAFSDNRIGRHDVYESRASGW